MDPIGFPDKNIRANGIDFTYAETGEGPLVLLLHGFPDTAKTWDRTLPLLAQAGYRAVAPNLRGYPPTSFSVEGDYQPLRLGEDVLALIEALGEEQAVLVGYDWGAAAAYCATLLSPERVDRFVTIGVPHPGAQSFSPIFFWRQRHIILFQFRRIGNRCLRRNNFALIDTLYQRWSPAWNILSDETDVIKQILRDNDDAVDAITQYYRSTVRAGIDKQSREVFDRSVSVPTLCFTGTADGGARMIDYKKHRYLFKGYYEEVSVEDAGHFLHREKPEEFHEILLRFLSRRVS